MPSRQLKILHVIFFLEPGGMENGIVNLGNRLDPRQFDVHYCCLERPGAFVERLPNRNNVHVLGKKKGFSVETVFGLRKLIGKLCPDVIHSHNLGPLIYSGLSSGFGFSCPIVHGEHSLLTPDECSGRRLRQRRLLYFGCREIHTVSSQLRNQLVGLHFPPQKISVIANGVDAERFIPGDVAMARTNVGLANLPGDAFVLGIVGRFGAFKRHAALIDAFSVVAKGQSNVHLLIVGDGGPEKERVREQAAKSHAAKRIHFAGFQQDMRPFYQAMDLVVVPSENEGMSNAVLEAMACGLPVLAHDICGNSEIITTGQDGFVADLSSVEKLTDELKNVLAVPHKMAKMKEMARATVRDKFSIDVMVERYAALYRKHGRNH